MGSRQGEGAACSPCPDRVCPGAPGHLVVEVVVVSGAHGGVSQPHSPAHGAGR